MIKFSIEREIEKTPTILNIRPHYFFIFFASIILSVYVIFQTLSWVIIVCLVVWNGGVYTGLWYRTECFLENKLSDEKIPEILSNMPIDE